MKQTDIYTEALSCLRSILLADHPEFQMCIRDSQGADGTLLPNPAEKGQKARPAGRTGCGGMSLVSYTNLSPVRIGRAREDTCPHCGGRMVDMLVLDGRDERCV